MPTQIHLSHLSQLARDLLVALELGPRSYRQSSSYHDYVALAFHGAAFKDADRATVERAYRKLCNEHGWECLHVSLAKDARMISVTMHESNRISTGAAGNRQMPL